MSLYDRDRLLLREALESGLVQREDWARAAAQRGGSVAQVLVDSGLLHRDQLAALRRKLHKPGSGRTLPRPPSSGRGSRRPGPDRTLKNPASSGTRRRQESSGARRLQDSSGSRRRDARAAWPLRPGTRLGPYTIKRRIGKGGMGQVFQVRHEKLKRDYAMKVLPPERANDASLLARFQHESRAAARLRHPNIVAVHDVGVQRGLHFFTMDLIEGRSLRAAINARDLSLREILEIFDRLALALYHAHTQGVIHRDLKPSNVLLSERGVPFLMDFGLAKQLHAHTHLTRMGKTVGTLAYMSPEQGMGKRELIGPHSDIFSLGTTLYEALCGRLPIQAKSVAEFVKILLDGNPTPPRTLRPDLPRGLSDLVLRMIARDVADRPGNALEVHRALRAELADLRKAEGWFPRVGRVGKVAGLLLGFGLAAALGVYVGPRLGYSSDAAESRALEVASGLERGGDHVGALAAYTRILEEQPAFHGFQRLQGSAASDAPREGFVRVQSAGVDVWVALEAVSRADYAPFLAEMDCGRGEHLRFVPRSTGDSGVVALWERSGEGWIAPPPLAAPVTAISAEDAAAYCAWRSARDDRAYRLLTPAEAARLAPLLGPTAEEGGAGTGFRLALDP